jgi:predicted RNase H-like HicB family nuclease
VKYPVAIKQQIGENKVTITVPDLPGCQEVAESIDVALVRINEAIASHLTILAEYGESIPSGQSIDTHIQQSHDRSIIWAIIDLDITPYLGRSHKINVTLPELLIKQIDEQVSKRPSYKTRSGFIAKACLSELAKLVKNNATS